MQFDPIEDSFTRMKSAGDILEREFSEQIQKVIPSYAKIWAEYIGNDGHANALPMPGVDTEAKESREKYWQRFYTIFESLTLCWDIEAELRHVQEIKSFRAYAHNLNQWMAFYSHLGRIHDMVKAIAGELRKPELLVPFDEFWKERHILLHGPKVPMKWVYNTLAAPFLGTKPKHWNDKMLWSDLKTEDCQFISEGVSATLRELERRLERCLAELRKILPTHLGWKPISWPSTEKPGIHFETVSSYEQIGPCERLAPSGTGGLPNISGSR